jgi:hypothetical protein
MPNSVGPHEYISSRRRWWMFWKREHCRACYHPVDTHPATTWRRARPIGDSRTAGEVMRAERLEQGDD